MVKLSIITVNLNNAAGLCKTIESVRMQTFKDFEHIIIDGGSSDESVNVIKEFADGFSYWVSEPDGGIYQGMNKGTKVAKGEYCLYLNSGDYLFDKKTLANVFKQKFSEDLIFGESFIKKNSKKTYLAKSSINLLNFVAYHQATLIKHSILNKLRGYNEQFKITGDWDFFIRAVFIYGASYRHIPVIISIYNLEGVSKNPKYAKMIKQEIYKIEKEIFPNTQIRLEIKKIGGRIGEIRKVKLRNIDLDLQGKIKNKDVYVWGVGIHTSKILNLLEKIHIRVEACLDSNKEYQGFTFAGYRIFNPEQILKQNKKIYIVISSENYYREIEKICESYGLMENKNYFVPFSI